MLIICSIMPILIVDRELTYGLSKMDVINNLFDK